MRVYTSYIIRYTRHSGDANRGRKIWTAIEIYVPRSKNINRSDRTRGNDADKRLSLLLRVQSYEYMQRPSDHVCVVIFYTVRASAYSHSTASQRCPKIFEWTIFFRRIDANANNRRINIQQKTNSTAIKTNKQTSL